MPTRDFVIKRRVLKLTPGYVRLTFEECAKPFYPKRHLMHEAQKPDKQFSRSLDSFLKVISDDSNSRILQFHVSDDTTFLTTRCFTMGLMRPEPGMCHRLSNRTRSVPIHLYISPCRGRRGSYLGRVNDKTVLVDKWEIKTFFNLVVVDDVFVVPEGLVYFFYTLSHSLFTLEFVASESASGVDRSVIGRCDCFECTFARRMHGGTSTDATDNEQRDDQRPRSDPDSQATSARSSPSLSMISSKVADSEDDISSLPGVLGDSAPVVSSSSMCADDCSCQAADCDMFESRASVISCASSVSSLACQSVPDDVRSEDFSCSLDNSLLACEPVSSGLTGRGHASSQVTFVDRGVQTCDETSERISGIPADSHDSCVVAAPLSPFQPVEPGNIENPGLTTSSASVSSFASVGTVRSGCSSIFLLSDEERGMDNDPNTSSVSRDFCVLTNSACGTGDSQQPISKGAVPSDMPVAQTRVQSLVVDGSVNSNDADSGASAKNADDHQHRVQELEMLLRERDEQLRALRRELDLGLQTMARIIRKKEKLEEENEELRKQNSKLLSRLARQRQ